MTGWIDEINKELDELIEQTGRAAEDLINELLPKYRNQIDLDAERRALSRFNADKRKAWAEPADDLGQLRFALNGYGEVAISASPVRCIGPDNEPFYKSPSHSTGAEREDSHAARIQHHLSWVRRSESELNREREQNAALTLLGVDIENLTWEELRDGDKVCWRCGLGYRAGDPFERGHYDRPESQGGVKTAWEHRSCNRSAQDNPTTERLDEDG